jgi:large repetitive protein
MHAVELITSLSLIPATAYLIYAGVHVLRVRAYVPAHRGRDRVTDDTPAQIEWRRDATPPTAYWVSRPERVTASRQALFVYDCTDNTDAADTTAAATTAGSGSTGSNVPALVPSTNSSSSSGNNSTTTADTTAAADDSADDEIGAGSVDSSGGSSTAQSVCTFESSFDGQQWQAVPRWLLFEPGSLSNAKHTLRVRAADAAGNVSPVLSYSFTVDNRSPDTVLVAAPAAATAATAAHFSLDDTVNVTAGLGGFEWRFDSASVTARHPAWRSLHEPELTLRDLSEGQHTVDIRAVTYTAGTRRDTVPIRHAWTVDTTAPDTSIVVYPAVVTHLRSAIFVVKASAPNVRFEYTLSSTNSTSSSSSSSSSNSTTTSSSSGDAQWTPAADATGVLHLYDLAEGAHCLQVRAVDAAGNADASPARHSWIVDRAGVYGRPSMPTNVKGSGGDQVATVQWERPSDDGGGAITK